MPEKIQLNIVLECDYTANIDAERKKLGDDGLNAFARDEVTKLLNGEEPDVDWAARILGITIKKG